MPCGGWATARRKAITRHFRSSASTTLEAAAEAPAPSAAEELVEAVKALHPDEMSPREALEAIYALKGKLAKG
jgi:DNA mismatch repair ATPase MutS